MARHKYDQPFILRENSEWLRYVMWSAAIGIGLLLASAINSPERDVGKIIGSAAGVLLLGFSGFVFRTRHIKIDPVRRVITITSKGFRQISTEILKFDAVDRIIVLDTWEYDSDLLPANRWQQRWLLALACKERSVLLNYNPYINKQQAMRDAMNIQRLLGVEITDTVEESITHLMRVGRKIEAIALATRTLGMSIEQAKDYVDKKGR
jgi:hypothetical protein